MYKHLQATVLAQVDSGVFVHRFRFALTQIVNHQAQCLLVVFHHLRLVGVGSAFNTRWQNIVNGCFVAVFFVANGAHSHLTCLCSRVAKVLLIASPLASNQVERTKTQHDGMFKAR